MNKFSFGVEWKHYGEKTNRKNGQLSTTSDELLRQKKTLQKEEKSRQKASRATYFDWLIVKQEQGKRFIYQCNQQSLAYKSILERSSYQSSTVKPLNSGHLRVLKNLSVIKRCPLLGGSLTKIVTFGTKHFVRYWRYVRYLGCPLLGGFTVVI